MALPARRRRATWTAATACLVGLVLPAGAAGTAGAAEVPAAGHAVARAHAGAPASAPPAPPAAVTHRVSLGRSVHRRQILAYHRYVPGAAVTRRVVVVGVIHGTEAAGLAVVSLLMAARLPAGVDLWLVPTMNPDGMAAHTRGNARGVDLNRNFPYSWARSARTATWSGPRAGSEPETVTVEHFLGWLRPRSVVVMHQPLDGVDLYHAKRPALVTALHRLTGLPERSFACGGVCHGTLTDWFNHGYPGAAATLELPARVSSALRARVAAGILRALATA